MAKITIDYMKTGHLMNANNESKPLDESNSRMRTPIESNIRLFIHFYTKISMYEETVVTFLYHLLQSLFKLNTDWMMFELNFNAHKLFDPGLNAECTLPHWRQKADVSGCWCAFCPVWKGYYKDLFRWIKEDTALSWWTNTTKKLSTQTR